MFFNNYSANILQHAAILLEICALFLIYFDLEAHKKDRKPKALSIVSYGLLTGIPNRARLFHLGMVVGVIAIFMELYQLGCIYFAE